jgi:predicted phosphoribosyltransferase
LVAISSGGVRIGVEVSKELGLPLRFLPVAGTRLAGQDEILAGAVAATGEHVFDDTALALAAPASPSLDQSLRNAEAKARRCRRRQQADHVAIPERAETILVSDGLDPDVCLRTAAEALRRRGTNHVTFAVPCHTERTLERARAWADLVVTAVPTDAGPTALAWYAALSPVPMSSVPALLRSCS